MAKDVIEIARQEGAEFRSVRLGVEDGGAIQLAAQDIGPKVAAIMGNEEYEFWVRVEPPALSKLAFELLREKFAGQLRAVDTFRDWCKAHGIEHEFGSWP
ncbi:MAG: hypothetical protein JO128_19065 [Alphaproteobacteria bacterium]|nr:hypothetical protein [Alphaproteobacteria bacterium]